MVKRAYAVVAQKGGVGKSYGAVSIATYEYQQGNRVLLVDTDTRNGSAKRWHNTRQAASVLPLERLAVFVSDNIPKIKAAAAGFDVVVLDGLAYGSSVAVQYAGIVDRVIIPTNSDDDELEKAAAFAFDLKAAGIDAEKIMFAFNRLTTKTETANALAALESTRFKISAPLRHSPAYAQAHARGNALYEVPFQSLRDEAHAYVKSLIC